VERFPYLPLAEWINSCSCQPLYYMISNGSLTPSTCNHPWTPLCSAYLQLTPPQLNLCNSRITRCSTRLDSTRLNSAQNIPSPDKSPVTGKDYTATTHPSHRAARRWPSVAQESPLMLEPPTLLPASVALELKTHHQINCILSTTHTIRQGVLVAGASR
jgi:hypothetical protein